MADQTSVEKKPTERRSCVAVYTFVKVPFIQSFFPSSDGLCVRGCCPNTWFKDHIFPHPRLLKVKNCQECICWGCWKRFPCAATSYIISDACFFFCNTPRAADQRCQSSQNRATPCIPPPPIYAIFWSSCRLFRYWAETQETQPSHLPTLISGHVCHISYSSCTSCRNYFIPSISGGGGKPQEAQTTTNINASPV